jgi:type II secretory pathway component PulF
VSQRMEALVSLIQPGLFVFGGIFLAYIAFSFLIPIYGSLTQIAGG